MTNLISKCKNISELDDIVDTVDFVREAGIIDDQIGYYCSICFESVQPSWKKQVSGDFLFNSEEDTTEDDGKQSRVLRNLKLHLKNHLITKTHQQKKELIQEKEARNTLRASREEKVGMNIF
jgi:hypothetical protein